MSTKRFETFEHTADLGLRAWADSGPELFEALAEGLAAQICSPQQVTPRELRRLQLAAEDQELLAVDFLWEVMTLLQGEGFLLARIAVTSLEEGRLSAELWGEPYDPDRHELLGEIKAVTYHQLRIDAGPSGWEGQVIIDI